jgi:LPXTG-motif cell wall-anchored protein
VVIESDEADVLCDCYDQDTLGVTQNDSRYPQQKHLEHKLLTASATVDGNAVDMEADKDSVHALVPLTVVNTRGFDLPQTGSNGNWMFPVLGLSVMALAGTVILILRKKK